MASKDRKRITVTVSDQLYAVLSGISDHTGEAKHAVLSEMLAPCEPVLHQLLDCLIQAKQAREMILPSLARAMDHLAGVVDEGARELRMVAEEARTASEASRASQTGASEPEQSPPTRSRRGAKTAPEIPYGNTGVGT